MQPARRTLLLSCLLIESGYRQIPADSDSEDNHADTVCPVYCRIRRERGKVNGLVAVA